ncbi:MAG: BrnT family toxin [Lachnospiraceae bacterium]|nr:BrnT family toxin [Lachnospiraceae bacterium]
MDERFVRFELGGITFEYDDNKNQSNIKAHGLSFRSAARVFFDYDRIEFYDDENSLDEDRYNTIGDLSAGIIGTNGSHGDVLIGNIRAFPNEQEEIVYVVYTERTADDTSKKDKDVIRLISARLATSFERGLYYGKHD